MLRNRPKISLSMRIKSQLNLDQVMLVQNLISEGVVELVEQAMSEEAEVVVAWVVVFRVMITQVVGR